MLIEHRREAARRKEVWLAIQDKPTPAYTDYRIRADIIEQIKEAQHMGNPVASKTVKKNRLLRGAVVVGICLILWFLPPVGTLSPQAMHLVATFIATVLGLILQPLPMGAIVISAIALTTITQTLPIGVRPA